MTPTTPLTYDGITQSITEWALDYGILPVVIIARLNRGQSIEAAITTPMIVAPGQKLPTDGQTLERMTGPTPKRRRSGTITALAKQHGILPGTLRNRLKFGMTLEQALRRPVREWRPNRGVSSNLGASGETGAWGSAQEKSNIAFQEDDKSE